MKLVLAVLIALTFVGHALADGGARTRLWVVVGSDGAHPWVTTQFPVVAAFHDVRFDTSLAHSSATVSTFPNDPLLKNDAVLISTPLVGWVCVARDSHDSHTGSWLLQLSCSNATVTVGTAAVCRQGIVEDDSALLTIDDHAGHMVDLEAHCSTTRP